ncbi:MAG: 2,3-bisphosphoglycerate-independent phosphoglycerate mutase [Planctomycetota bacterium]|nr:MAG: 2,3-bisphosphoglycerate-independent phosphoglycerate mutase [Planctomycetota bacterium]
MPTPTPRNTPFVLIIRDGWGENPHPEHDAFNAVKIARTPVADRLEREYPRTLIRTSGLDVGLPAGTMGNSEVGHQNIGAGRIVDQESVRISKAIESGEFFENQALRWAIEGARDAGRAVHLISICSDAGVHGLLEHLFACLELCRRLGAERVFVHCVTDGRDTGPFTGAGYVEQVERACRRIGVGRIASVIGRYWAMDRDHRWERVARAYACLTGRGAGERGVVTSASAVGAVRAYYDAPMSDTQKGDEFVTPTMIGSPEEARASRIGDGDAVVFVNYRGDRPREIVRAFVMPEFQGRVPPSPDTGARGFDRGPRLGLRFVTMTAYEEELGEWVRVAFPKPPKMQDILGAYLSRLGVGQFRCAETEKFPHVTFFFNDYRDEPFPGEARVIVQSPKVATYDLAPEMSAAGVRDAVLARLGDAAGEPVVVVNFANPDMVGHTGSLEAAVRACETVDACVGAVVDAALARGGSAIVTADHGNAEQMFDPETGSPHTAHTTYDVPLIVAGEAFRGRRLRAGGRLADIAPTTLDIIGLPAPAAMTGRSLLEE